MDQSEIYAIRELGINPSDWADSPQPIQRVILELLTLIGRCKEQIESQQTQIEIFMQQAQAQNEQIQHLKDEIAKLKGHKPRPDIKPSTLEKNTPTKEKGPEDDGKRPGSAKRKKTEELEIHDTKLIKPDHLPPGSKFKSYQDWVVQDIVIKSHNTRFRLERWETPEGKYVVGKLPDELGGGHFGPTVVSFILYQYFHARVTEPLLLEQLHEFDIDISKGQLNNIIIRSKERFHAEKDEILRVGLEVSRHINVDDTGARHQGKNGYCTHIGNEWFAWFESTDSKSRINFLRLLRAGRTDYLLNDHALEYMLAQNLAQAQQAKFVDQEGQTFKDDEEWEANLKRLDITHERHIRIATEGALLGSALEHGIHPDLAIMSDDAGQFNVLLHTLCWIHMERGINKLIPCSDKQREELGEVRSAIWELYADLKAYKEAPAEDKKAKLEARFDEIFTQTTGFSLLNHALERIHKNKEELLLVLERPDLPLHNNLSESDIREYVTRRKISGSTRHELGRRCRDTFTSLKKTCRKLGISFWKYLTDRISHIDLIPQLGEVIRQRAQEARMQ